MASRKKSTTQTDVSAQALMSISGADYVREKLAALAAIGPTPLYDDVYAIKIRTKTAKSLEKKVLKKRSDGKSNYKAADATDLVGMRLLVLFASDLPNAIRSLLTFVRFCQIPAISIISGDSLDAGIKEIIVYKSKHAENSVIYENVYRYCKAQQISSSDSKGNKKIDLKDFEDTGRPYSSIHFVLNGVSYSGGESKPIPIEVQVRSIFEDTWGEIDHMLEYKFKEKTECVKIPPDIASFYKNYAGMLRGLKNQLEEVGRTAEYIRDGYLSVIDKMPIITEDTNLNPFNLSPVFYSDNFEETIRIHPRTHLQRDFTECFNDIREISQEVKSELSRTIYNTAGAESMLTLISDYAMKIEALHEKLKKGESLSPAAEKKVIYFLKMDEALAYMWMYIIQDHFYATSLENNRSFIDKSINVYLELEKNKSYSNDCFLQFRLGCAFVSKGSIEYGESFIYRALELMSSDKRVRSSIFSAVFPHFMSFVVWLRRASLLSIGRRANNPRVSRDKQVEDICEALFWTLFAKYNYERIADNTTSFSVRLRRDISNNVIAYLWELIDISLNASDVLGNVSNILMEVDEEIQDFGGSKPKGGFRIDFQGCYGDLREAVESDSHDLQYVDTAMKYCRIVGDDAEFSRLYEILKSGSERSDQSISSETVREMVRYSLDRVKKGRDTNALAENLAKL